MAYYIKMPDQKEETYNFVGDPISILFEEWAGPFRSSQDVREYLSSFTKRDESEYKVIQLGD